MSFDLYKCQIDISGTAMKTTLTRDSNIVLRNTSNKTNTVNSSSMFIQDENNSVLVNVSGVTFSGLAGTSSSLGPTQLYLNDGTTTIIQAGSYTLDNANVSTTLIPGGIQLNDMNVKTAISPINFSQTQVGLVTDISPNVISVINTSFGLNKYVLIVPGTIHMNGSTPLNISSNGIVYTLGGTTTAYTQQGTSFKTGDTQNNYLNSDTLKTTYIVDTSNSSGTTNQLLTQSASGLQWANTIKPFNISDSTNSVGTTNQILHKSATGLEWTSTIQPSNISDTTNSVGTTNQILAKSATGLRWTSTIQPTNISDTGNSVGTTNQILTKIATALRWTSTIQPTNISDSANSIGTTDQLLIKTASGIRWTSTIQPTNIVDANGLRGTNGQYLQKQGAGILWDSISQFNPVLYGGSYVVQPSGGFLMTPANTLLFVPQTQVNITGATGTASYLVNCNFIVLFGGTSNTFYATLGASNGTDVQAAATTINMCDAGFGFLSANSITTAPYYGVAYDFRSVNLNYQTLNLSMIWQPNSATGWSVGLWVRINTTTSRIMKCCMTVTKITPY